MRNARDSINSVWPWQRKTGPLEALAQAHAEDWNRALTLALALVDLAMWSPGSSWSCNTVTSVQNTTSNGLREAFHVLTWRPNVELPSPSWPRSHW